MENGTAETKNRGSKIKDSDEWRHSILDPRSSILDPRSSILDFHLSSTRQGLSPAHSNVRVPPSLKMEISTQDLSFLPQPSLGAADCSNSSFLPFDSALASESSTPAGNDFGSYVTKALAPEASLNTAFRFSSSDSPMRATRGALLEKSMRTGESLNFGEEKS